MIRRGSSMCWIKQINGEKDWKIVMISYQIHKDSKLTIQDWLAKWIRWVLYSQNNNNNPNKIIRQVRK